jgi:dihydroorotase-like cyclic amidohydrolase
VSLLIKDATVIDGVSDKALENQSILIEGKRIKAIGRLEGLRVPDSTQTLDARG